MNDIYHFLFTKLKILSIDKIMSHINSLYSSGLFISGKLSAVHMYFNIIYILYSGLIISGGIPSDSVGQSVEVYVPTTGQHCQLPDLPDRRRWHTMEKMMVCGGEDTRTSCLTLTGDGWENTTEMMIRKMFNTNENITTEVGSGR